MTAPFLILPPESQQDASEQTMQTRRRFVKSTGAATVAALVAFNLETAAAAVTAASASCSKLKCTYEPHKTDGEDQYPVTTPTASGDKYMTLSWELHGPKVGDTTGCGSRLTMQLSAVLKLWEIKTLGGITAAVVIASRTGQISQDVYCDCSTCTVMFDPNPAYQEFPPPPHSPLPDLQLALKMQDGNVTSIYGRYNPPHPDWIIDIDMTFNFWSYECV